MPIWEWRRFVFRSTGLHRKSGRLAQAMTDLAAPNGLAFSPDEKILYVVEAARCRTG